MPDGQNFQPDWVSAPGETIADALREEEYLHQCSLGISVVRPSSLTSCYMDGSNCRRRRHDCLRRISGITLILVESRSALSI